jgi:hypothetical protein
MDGDGESYNGVLPAKQRNEGQGGPKEAMEGRLLTRLRARLHGAIGDTVKWLKAVVSGYFQYHAIPDNEEQLKAFRHDVLRLWLKQLRRRSQRHRWTWERFYEKLGALLPEVEILQPYPDVRFDAKIRGKNRVR